MSVSIQGRLPGGRAVVIGAGMSGLLSARSLSGYFGEVVVLERDALPASGDTEPMKHRKGIPQDRHLHTLTTRGSELLEGFFPGLDERLSGLGAPGLDQSLDLLTAFPEGALPRFPSGLTLRAVSRATIESEVRRRVEGIPNVSMIRNHRVTHLLHSKGRVFGVGFSGGEVEADLVVDASGGASGMPGMLAGIGYSPPGEEVVDARLGYATRWYEAPKDPEFGSVAVLPDWPDDPRGGTVRIVEGGLMTAVLIGIGNVQPPSGKGAGDAFERYAKRLHHPAFYGMLDGARPVSGVYGYRRTANRRRRYDRARMPDGLIVVGDAACVLNPSYGQGMTLAAMSAVVLEGSLSDVSSGFERRFHRAQTKALSAAWRTTTASDRRWTRPPENRGITARYADRFSSEIVRRATRDERLARDLLAVKNLVAPPTTLARPSVVLPAAVRALRSR